MLLISLYAGTLFSSLQSMEQKAACENTMASKAAAQSTLNKAFAEAVRVSKLDLAQSLLAKGAEVNFKDETDGDTLLHKVILDIRIMTKLGCSELSEQHKLLKLLLAHGADPEIKNNQGLDSLSLLKVLRKSLQPAYREFVLKERLAYLQKTSKRIEQMLAADPV